MHCLFLDIASHDGLLACVTDAAVSASQSVSSPVSDHDLVPAMEKLCKEVGWSEETPYDGVDHVACIVGPGGFTSLRVAVTYANVLADQLDVPLASIHQSDAYRARCGEDDLLWLHSTKKTELFVRGFGAHEVLFPEAALQNLDVFIEAVQAGLHGAFFIGELLSEHEEALASAGLHRAETTPLSTVLPQFLSLQDFQKMPILPWYGREG